MKFHASIGAGGCGQVKEKRARYLANSEARSMWANSPSLPEAVQEIYPCAHQGRLHLAGGFTAQDGTIVGPTAAHGMVKSTAIADGAPSSAPYQL